MGIKKEKIKVIAIIKYINHYVRDDIGQALRDENFQTKYVGQKIIKVVR